MKTNALIAGILIALLNALAFVPALAEYTVYFLALSIAFALWLVAKTLLYKAAPEEQGAVGPSAAAPPEPKPAPELPKHSAEAEVLATLGALQSKGRFVDFLMDDISHYSDAQVGAAARVVHQGCRSAIDEMLSIEPISSEKEGAEITVPEGSKDDYRLLGNISGEAPFTGKLVHKGWKATRVNLPRVIKLEGDHLPPIAPAQVELK